jgi:hypothetical protein
MKQLLPPRKQDPTLVPRSCGHPVGVVGFLVASAALGGLSAFFVALSAAFFE